MNQFQLNPLAIPLLIIAGMIVLVYILNRRGYEPAVPRSGSVADYLVDPDTKLAFVYVVPWAIIQEYGEGPFVVHGNSSFQEKAGGTVSVKLTRSGSGFRVYGHPEVKDGTWLPCR